MRIAFVSCLLSSLASAAFVAGPALAAPPSVQLPYQGPPDLTLPTASRATGLNIADLNGDGGMDVILLSGQSPNLTVIMGQPGSKFAMGKRIDVPAGASASALALGDINEDGKLDVVVCHHDTDELWLFLGKGDGTFLSPMKIKVQVTKPHCHAIVARDMNHDQHLDLILAESDDNCVWVLLGDGKGKFTKSPGSPMATDRHPYVVEVADFNGDNYLDIATPNWFGKSVGVFLGDGKGGFAAAPGSPFKGLQDPTALAAGDLDGDGRTDLVVGNNGARGLQVFLGDGHGRFHAGDDLNPVEPCYGPSLADLNGDGKLDVVSTSTGAAATLSYWINQGGGKFGPAQTLPCPNGANTIRVADLHHDGAPDLCVGPWKEGPVLVWLGGKSR